VTDVVRLDAASDGSGIAVIIPCHNEAVAIARVVSAFRAQPGVTEVLVVDNNSSDDTARIAASAGARVVRESRPGKGFALATGLREATPSEFFVMVDGDDTYPAESLPQLIASARAGHDMVIGTRLATREGAAFRKGHDFGNRLFILLVRLLFRLKTNDLFSGYRVLSRRFVESAPLLAQGFEIELELSLQALSNNFRVAEHPVEYRARPHGSLSKLRTYVDGFKILRSLVLFFRDYRPMAFLGTSGVFLMIISLVFGFDVVRRYLETGQVLRLPLAVLSVALFLLGALSLTCGTVLTSINRRAAEIRTLISGRASSARRT